MINEGVKNGRKLITEYNNVDSTYSGTACIYGTDGKELQFNYVDEDNEE